MNRFALVVLTDLIKVSRFEHRDDFDTAQQTLVTKGIKMIPLKWYEGAQVWQQPEVCE